MTSPSLDRFRRELRGLWSRLAKIDWSDQSFTADKAYVAAVFSKIAYLAIPAFELRSHTSAKVVPCLTYQQLVQRNVSVDLRALVQSFELGEVVVIPSRYAIAVIVFGHDVTFISLRGTRPLYLTDWMIDFHITRTPAYVNQFSADFHSGFFKAVNSLMDELSTRITARLGARPSVPIYVVGHSLGGAMAAITHSVAGSTYFSKLLMGQNVVVPFPTHSCYTYGMPRYGDTETTRGLRGPNHIYNVHDVVPGVPPKWLGFDNATTEYRLREKGKLLQMPQDKQGLDWWISRVKNARGIRFHFVERYIHALQ